MACRGPGVPVPSSVRSAEQGSGDRCGSSVEDPPRCRGEPAYNAARTLVRTYRDIPPGVSTTSSWSTTSPTDNLGDAFQRYGSFLERLLAVLREVGLHLASPSPRLAVVEVLTCTNRNGSQGEAVGLASCFRRSGPSNGVLLDDRLRTSAHSLLGGHGKGDPHERILHPGRPRLRLRGAEPPGRV